MSADRKNWDSTTTEWKHLKPIARQMRKEPTAGEHLLWQKIRNRSIENAKFRRQHPIGPFVADFACLDAMLVIEVDGDSHAGNEEYDRMRQQQIESAGYRVLRFHDADVLRNTYAVLSKIREVLLEGRNG